MSRATDEAMDKTAPAAGTKPAPSLPSIAHAANAYPRLVATLKRAYASSDKATREEIGALLMELGE